MDYLMRNQTFRIIKDFKAPKTYEPGVYRVILNCGGKIAAALINPARPGDKTEEDNEDDDAASDDVVGRDRTKSAPKKRGRPRKQPKQTLKPPKPPLITEVHWMETQKLTALREAMKLRPVVVERHGTDYSAELSAASKAAYEARRRIAAAMLDIERIRPELELTGSLSRMFTEIMAIHGVSRPHVLQQWSELCRMGFDERSLLPRLRNCGAKGVVRRCDKDEVGKPRRKKAGRKDPAQREAKLFGESIESLQPGMCTDWADRILLADAQMIGTKPRWSVRRSTILDHGFVTAYKMVDGKLQPVLPEFSYPNDDQIRRVLRNERSHIQRLLDRTTARHFKGSQRGFVGRIWEGIQGPGHVYAIDSTVGDIYLRSAVNPAWIIGRPIVYIVCDLWSTAIVGFYVCLTGPSWATAAVSLFNSAAHPELLSELWGFEHSLGLDPLPGMAYSVMFDRGEGLSKGERTAATKIIPHTQITPPYRGDLKGLVEVLHRVQKDQQFLFVPGALNYRRKEMEFRKIDPASSVLTLKEYVRYLAICFRAYNLASNRSGRVDAHMIGDECFPSPAGLWYWGHAVGIAFTSDVTQSDLVMNLLPAGEGYVGRNSVKFQRCDYSAASVRAAQWTTLARNFGGWELPVRYYPGSMSRIWTPHDTGKGLIEMQISDQSNASPELTHDEFLDAHFFQLKGKQKREHQRTIDNLSAHKELNDLIAGAKLRTAAADEKWKGERPTWTEARAQDVSASEVKSTKNKEKAEEKATVAKRQAELTEHEKMMERLMRKVDNREQENA